MQIPTIDCRRDDAATALSALRDKLSPRGDIVSEAGRRRTISLFGDPLSPHQVVDRICGDVRGLGLSAVLDYTEKLDGKRLTQQTMQVSEAELAAAVNNVDEQFLAAVRRVRENVTEFQRAILHEDVALTRSQGDGVVTLSQRYLPLRRVGVCVPGGAAAYPSTVLMTVVPAQVAGVEEIAVVVPPTDFGGYNDELLATCRVLGVSEVHRVGGAQAVAALAYGVDGIERVDKIVGPGNLFVALAKQHVFGAVDIDSIAGPSEVIVLADETARPEFVAADLISQAEHSPGSAVLITWHEPLIARVQAELDRQTSRLSRGDLARAALQDYGALVFAENAAAAVHISNAFAPEHLHVSTREPRALLPQLRNAGAVFLGHFTPVAAGDYIAGPSHVLPTGGTARFANGLCANDFLKRSSVIEYDLAALVSDAAAIELLAGREGLTGHAASVQVRTGSD